MQGPEKGCPYNNRYNGFMGAKLRKIGSGYGVLLPKKIIDNLRLSVGDELELTESEGGIELSPFRRTEGAAPEQRPQIGADGTDKT